MKVRILLLISILFFASDLAGKNAPPRNIYHFSDNYFNTLQPYSDSVSERIRMNRFQRVFVLWTNDDGSKLIYLFDSDGRLTNIESLTVKKKKEIWNYSIYLNYNNNGKLVKRHEVDKFRDAYVVLNYNENGRLVMFSKYDSLTTRKENGRRITYHRMFVSQKTSKYYELRDEMSDLMYRLNELNEIVYSRSGDAVDSVSAEMSDGYKIKKFWYRYSAQAPFRLGKEISYLGERMQTEKFYYTDGKYELAYTTVYHYNALGQLILTENTDRSGSGKVLLYNRFGLIASEVTFDSKDSWVRKYQYFTR